MDSSTRSSDRISHLEHYNDNGLVTVTVYWRKYDAFDAVYKDTSNRRWLRRQVKRIVDHIENDVEIKKLDLFLDATDVVFYHDNHAAQFILEHS